MRDAPSPAPVRCAIYTRKSSEEGLEQSFNSLHAQREACEAYVKSQAHEGWSCSPTTYDDGGFSGGTMERPALKRLLADIAARQVNVVVVYKVDRLTRSLADFAKIVETFDAAGASFVSITQSFNTTTSMGRLTLNVLLSFAQFEREVTGERIRDKIAASKKKGMWMGGTLPLGYDAQGRTLVVNEAEAATVRHIFGRYLAIGSVHRLQDELERDGIRSKQTRSSKGRARGGVVIGRGALLHTLQNRLYVGQIRHKDKHYPGAHPAIVEPALFDAVQAKLQKHRTKRRAKPPRTASAALTGKLVDQDGAPYTPTFAYGRKGRRYGYYVLTALQHGRGRRVGEVPARIPSEALDDAVLACLAHIAGRACDWDQLGPALTRAEVRADGLRLTLDAEALFGADHPDLALEDLQARLRPGERAGFVGQSGKALIVAIPGKPTFRGGRAWCSHAPPADYSDRTLIQALKSAHRLLADAGLSPNEVLLGAQAPASPYHRRLCRLALLAPQIQAAILAGTQPAHLTLGWLMEAQIPLAWEDQVRALMAAP